MATQQQLEERLTAINEQLAKLQGELDGNPEISDGEWYVGIQSEIHHWNGRKEEIEFALNG